MQQPPAATATGRETRQQRINNSSSACLVLAHYCAANKTTSRRGSLALQLLLLLLCSSIALRPLVRQTTGLESRASRHEPKCQHQLAPSCSLTPSQSLQGAGASVPWRRFCLRSLPSGCVFGPIPCCVAAWRGRSVLPTSPNQSPLSLTRTSWIRIYVEGLPERHTNPLSRKRSRCRQLRIHHSALKDDSRMTFYQDLCSGRCATMFKVSERSSA